MRTGLLTEQRNDDCGAAGVSANRGACSDDEYNTRVAKFCLNRRLVHAFRGKFRMPLNTCVVLIVQYIF